MLDLTDALVGMFNYHTWVEYLGVYIHLAMYSIEHIEGRCDYTTFSLAYRLCLSLTESHCDHILLRSEGKSRAQKVQSGFIFGTKKVFKVSTN